MTLYYCRSCRTKHVRIVQAAPVHPVGHFRHLAADLFVIGLVILAVLLWIASQA